MTKSPPKTNVLIRLDAELLAVIENVHHGLRFKSREAAMRAMLEAGGRALFEAGDAVKRRFLQDSAARRKRRILALDTDANIDRQDPKEGVVRTSKLKK